MRNYPPEVKADAVALYESRPDATVRSVTADLGIISETLRIWGEGCGGKPSSGGSRTQEPAPPPAPLEAVNAALRKKVRELEEEHEILRKAAQYFAGETRR
ncbi:hypothetical protein SATRM34S_07075 [Streptomyces atroolivaceus]